MEENTTPPLERRCPACGAAMPQQARFCGACGAESHPPDTHSAAAPPAAAPEPLPAPVVADAPAAPAAPAAPLPTPIAATRSAGQANGAAGRTCTWCDAVNPPDAVRCVACAAVFPTPEGNEALERAAQARIQSMESELNERRGGWWPFRSR